MSQQMIDPRANNAAAPPKSAKELKKEQRARKKAEEEAAFLQYAEEYYDYENNQQITYESLKKARKYKIVAFVFVIITILICLLYVFVFQASIANARTSCYSNQAFIEEAAEQYVVINGFSSLPAYVEDIPTVDIEAYKCPNGGTYTWNSISGTYTCSEHGHYPELFTQPSSISHGKTTQTIETKK